MTDSANRGGSSPARQTVTALLEERQRYQSWLDALDAKRGSTPEHVFARVRQDYERRLREVIQQLAGHLPALRQASQEMAAQLDALRQEEGALRDGRAEAELRALVGEVASGEWERAAQQHDARIAEVAARRERLERELQAVAALATSTRNSLETAAIPDAPLPARGAATPPGGSGSGGRDLHDELAFLQSVTDGVPTAQSKVDDAVRAAQAATEVQRRPPTAPPREPQKIVESRDVSDPLEGFQGAERPLAGYVQTNDAIILRAESDGAQRTLKCGECGAMNFPSEWYCEKCGSELSAL